MVHLQKPGNEPLIAMRPVATARPVSAPAVVRAAARNTVVRCSSHHRATPMRITSTAADWRNVTAATSSNPLQNHCLRSMQRTDAVSGSIMRSEEHTSELQSRQYLVCRLL